MKKVIFIMVAFVLIASCSTEDDVDLSVSQSDLAFSPEMSEQVVDISSEFYWDCEYKAEWLLVRQQQDKIRVVVDANKSSEKRTDVIKITVNGSVKRKIKVTQEGTNISLKNNSVMAESKGDTIILPIKSNVKWSIENDNDWCSAKEIDNQLELIVDRNFDMAERVGFVSLSFGEVSEKIKITQNGCAWYESFEMVDVEAGSFYMGAQNVSSGNQNYDVLAYQIESPVHKVSLSAYSIGKFEVTQAQWMAAMGNNPSAIQGANLPVENVSWDNVQEFIALLNEASGLNYRLPTEAEWEFAAKGGNQSDGFKYSGNFVLGACGWFYSNSDATSHEVGGKDANELGLFDMSGNVREWCNDWFGYYSSSSTDNPKGPSTGDVRVNRGGSWTTPAVNCRNTYRHSDNPTESAQDLGFRLALTR